MREKKHEEDYENPEDMEADATMPEGDLQERFDSLKTEAEGYLDSLQRERASFANYRRRNEQENAEIVDRALGDHVKIFLPVIDDLERALKHRPQGEGAACESWVDGIALILQKLMKTLENKGVLPLAIVPGDEFDPTTQEAISHEDNNQFTDNQVIEVVQTGYKVKDRIIRPALVRVAK